MKKCNLESYSDALRSAGMSQSWRSRAGKWPIYAAAAGAALASATSAEAGLIVYGYSGKTITASANGIDWASTEIDPTHLGAMAMNLYVGLKRLNGHTYQWGSAALRDPGASFLMGPGFGIPVLARYFPGGLITQGPNGGGYFKRSTGLIGYTWDTPGRNDVVGGVFGFKLSNGDLGWIEISGGNGFGVGSLTALEWAYNTTPGAPILPGVTSGEGVTPEPGTIAMAVLALGAAGILALRRRRAAA